MKIPVWFRGQRVGQFEGDMLVEEVILLELKVAQMSGSVPLRPASELSQSYGYRGGAYYWNFGLKPEFKRLILDNASKFTTVR